LQSIVASEKNILWTSIFIQGKSD